MKKQKNKKNNSPENKKNYYRKLITEHKHILAKARGLIEMLLDRLEKEVNNPSDRNIKADKDEIEKNTRSPSLNSSYFLFGEKESATSIIFKLTQVLLKLIPLEQEIARADLTKADLLELEELSVKARIPEEDLQIIERYVEKYNEQKD